MGNGDSPALQDYISLFPLDDIQPSKLMRLLSSSEEDTSILSSPSESVAWAGCLLPSLGSHFSPRRLLCGNAQPQASWLAGQRVCGRSLSHSVPYGCSVSFL